MNAILTSQSMPYGAPELRRAARPDMVRALLLSSLLVTIAFAVAWSLSPFLRTNRIIVIPPPPPEYHPESFRIQPPPPPFPQTPQVNPTPARRVAEATPVVVQDSPPPAEPPAGNPAGTEVLMPPTTTGGGQTGVGDAGDVPVNQPGEILFVERYPTAIRRVTPHYPEIARDAGVAGTVVVYVLVGKDGRVREVKLHPEKHQPMLDAAALEAARAWSFEPALSNGRPVPVWVSVPFKFALR